MQLNYDYIITVIADEELRIERILKRDDTTREKIEAIIKNQWTDAQKKELSDFIITNSDLASAKTQALQIHNKLLKLTAK